MRSILLHYHLVSNLFIFGSYEDDHFLILNYVNVDMFKTETLSEVKEEAEGEY